MLESGEVVVACIFSYVVGPDSSDATSDDEAAIPGALAAPSSLARRGQTPFWQLQQLQRASIRSAALTSGRRATSCSTAWSAGLQWSQRVNYCEVLD